MTFKYTTSKPVGLFLLTIALLGWGSAIFNSPYGLRFDSTVLILTGIAIFMFFDLMWGTHVSIEDNFLIRTDNFFMKKKIAILDVDVIRYQPTYGVGKEASSLYVFKKNDDEAVFTMTSLWFGEKILSNFLNDLKKLNPNIRFDDEAQNLVNKNN